MEKQIRNYQILITKQIQKIGFKNEPALLYESMEYATISAGKRVRPILALLSSKAICGEHTPAIPIAVAVELFHNFTLVHDDIMDKAELRHNKLPVYKKWDADTAILSGDSLFALAYIELLKSNSPHIKKICRIFSQAAMDVCVGQALDKIFETKKDVTLQDYFCVIKNKTGRLIQISMQLGAIAANASLTDEKKISSIGLLVGTAFQLQDDLLDVIASKKTFGKTIGGDILQGKKTYLLLRAIELTKGNEKKMLRSIIKNNGIDKSKIKSIIAIYQSCGVIEETKETISTYIHKSKKILSTLQASKDLERYIDYHITNRLF